MLAFFGRYFEIYKVMPKGTDAQDAFPDTEYNRKWLAAGNSAEFNGFVAAGLGSSESEMKKIPGLIGYRTRSGAELWKKSKQILATD